ncbi:hypothetical protein AAG906_014370 [Vitis piasezkii]
MNIDREAIGYHVQWSTHLLIFGQDSMKEKKKKKVVKSSNKSQEGVVEYGYFVMRYMKEIIDDPNPYYVKNLCLLK